MSAADWWTTKITGLCCNTGFMYISIGRVDNEKAQLCSGTEVGGAVLFTCALPLRALVPFNAAF